MFKVSKRNTRKRYLEFKNNVKTSKRRHLTASYLPEVTVQNHVTVFPRIYTNLQSSPTAHNFSNSRTIYVILWKMRNHYRNIWFMKNSKCQHFLFPKNSPQNWQSFQLFTLYSNGRHFIITKLDILIFCNILHLEIDFWNLSSKRIVSLWTFGQKCHEKHYKWDIEKNGIAYSTARNLKTASETFISIRITRNNTF